MASDLLSEQAKLDKHARSFTRHPMNMESERESQMVRLRIRRKMFLNALAI
jgi:hypothetical protein